MLPAAPAIGELAPGLLHPCADSMQVPVSPHRTPMRNRPASHRQAAAAMAASFTLLALGGCGAEVAGTATAVGAMQAGQAQQAQAQQERLVQQLQSAQAAGVARTASAAD
jgi:hypothetical protein